MLIGVDASRAAVAHRTGTETYSLHLIHALLRAGTDHTFRLYTNRPPVDGLLPEGLFGRARADIRALPFPRLWTHVRLSAEMLTRPPDVLFVPAHVLPLVHPRRSVATVHDLGFLYYPEAHRPADLRYLRWSTGWNARQSAAVIADSAATKADLVRAYGIPAGKVHVVYLGGPEGTGHPSAGVEPLPMLYHTPAQDALVTNEDVQAEQPELRGGSVSATQSKDVSTGTEASRTLGYASAQADCTAVLHKYGLTDATNEAPAPYLLYVGTLQPRKNLTRVINAFARVAARPELAGFRLVLAGKQGWLYEDLVAQVERLGLAGRVQFPGYIPSADLPALLRGARAFVYPSLYEGFGLPVLEAGAYGVPVITSNTSSLPEVAGDAALLVDPHDVDAIAAAMYRLVTDDALAAELARRGQENVKRFSWQKCAAETLAVLESVVKGR